MIRENFNTEFDQENIAEIQSFKDRVDELIETLRARKRGTVMKSEDDFLASREKISNFVERAGAFSESLREIIGDQALVSEIKDDVIADCLRPIQRDLADFIKQYEKLTGIGHEYLG